MAEETIPLQFEAVDKLSASVTKMTALLEKLVGQQEASTEATEENAKAQDQASQGLSKLDKALAIARNGTELLGMAWENGKAIYEGVVAVLDTSLSKWDEQVKRTGRSASSLGSISDAAERAEKAQNKVLTSLGKLIDKTGIGQLAYDAKRDALAKLDSLLNEYGDDLVGAAKTIAGDFIGALRDSADWISENAETVARFKEYLDGLLGVLGFAAKSVEIVGRAAQVWITAQFALATGALEKMVSGLEFLIESAGGEVPQALEDMRLGLEATNKGAKAAALDGLDKLIVASDEGAEQLVGIAGNFVRAFGEADEELKATTESIKKTADTASKVLTEQEKKLKDAEDKKGGRAKRAKDEQLEEERRQAQLLKLELMIVEARAARNEPLAIELERSKAILETEHSLLGVKDKGLKGLSLSLSYRQAELEAAEKLKAITDAQTASALEAGAAARANYVALQKAALEFQASAISSRGGEGDAEAAAGLERQAKVLELNERLRTIEDDQLRAATERLELQKIEYEFETKLYQAQSARRDMTLSLIDATAAQWESVTSNFGSLASEALAQDMEGWTARIDANTKYMEGLDELGKLDEATKKNLTAQNEALADEMDRASASAERQAKAFQMGAQAAGVMATALAKVAVNNKGMANSQEEVSSALSAGVGLGSALVSAYTDNVKTRAKWDAAFNAAAAIAATALSFVNPAFIPVAIGHGIAAAQFGLIAGGVIGGGGSPSIGGGGGGGGGASAAQASGTTVDLDRERRLTAESIAESIGASNRGPGGVVQVVFNNALIASTSPQAAQELADILMPELNRRLLTG